MTGLGPSPPKLVLISCLVSAPQWVLERFTD